MVSISSLKSTKRHTPPPLRKGEKYCSLNFRLILLLLAFIVSEMGCTGERGSHDGSDFQLNLSPPEVAGEEVTINGGVAVPVERIQWDWGDGQIDHHHFFPATHSYEKPGRYEVTVTVFDNKNRSTTKSVIVDIK